MNENNYTINVEQPNIDINISDPQDFTIEVSKEPDIVIELNKQGPPGPPGAPGANVVSVEPIEQSGYDVTYRMLYSDNSYFDFTVTNGTGMNALVAISEDNWVLEGSTYKYTIAGSYSIVGVYEGTVSNKTLVADINVSVINGITYIYSLEPFDGYALVAAVGSSPEPAGVYIHEQGTPASIWEIEHNLNTYPSITVTDTAGNVVLCDKKYNNANKVTLNFTSAVKGTAYLNYTR